MDAASTLANRVRELVLSGLGPAMPPPHYASKSLWARVKSCGTELWLDTGDIQEASALWSAEFSAVTTNNTLLNREVQKGAYDELIARAAGELKGMVPPEQLPLEIAFVLNACHGLKLSRLLGAKVSVELHTDLAHDVARSVAYGRRYHHIAPGDFYIKVPHTPAGLLAARRLGEEGIPVNYTLGFSARQNYLITTLARPAFVNVFLGRLNSFVADNGLGTGELVGEKATLASQQAVLELRGELGLTTRQIAASMREGRQVLALAGVDVHTLPTGVARQFEELNPPKRRIVCQVGVEYEVALAAGVDRQALAIDALWEVPDALRAAVAGLAASDVSRLSPEGICRFLAERGLGDLLPEWSAAEVGAVRTDGKIPRLPRWQAALAQRKVGLDALMTLSGLESFATDQKAMDDRIRAKL
jgi:transaldolase